MLEFRGFGEGLGGVAAVEGVAETVVGGALRPHERMFAHRESVEHFFGSGMIPPLA